MRPLRLPSRSRFFSVSLVGQLGRPYFALPAPNDIAKSSLRSIPSKSWSRLTDKVTKSKSYDKEGKCNRKEVGVSHFTWKWRSTSLRLRRKSVFPPCRPPSTTPCSSISSGPMRNEDLEDGIPVQLPLLDSILLSLQSANAYLPQVIAASTAVALLYPPSFTWFTTKFYAPALGFLMFAVGLNLSPSDFQRAFQQPSSILLGYTAQFGVKPLLGLLLASTMVPWMGLPEAVGSGLILTSCVSGAQLSNYATFLVDPQMAPLSIVLTALSTATAAVVTPFLTLLLLGQRLPVDPGGMMASITQIVVGPIAVGLIINKFAAPLGAVLRPCLPPLSVLTTALCVGSPLATNIRAVRSGVGAALLLPVCALHAVGFVAGYGMSAAVFKGQAPLARTISFETGMQSSLLGLALANKFFSDPLVGLPSALSVIVMSLMGFGLVTYWNYRKSQGGE